MTVQMASHPDSAHPSNSTPVQGRWHSRRVIVPLPAPNLEFPNTTIALPLVQVFVKQDQLAVLALMGRYKLPPAKPACRLRQTPRPRKKRSGGEMTKLSTPSTLRNASLASQQGRMLFAFFGAAASRYGRPHEIPTRPSNHDQVIGSSY